MTHRFGLSICFAAFLISSTALAQSNGGILSAVTVPGTGQITLQVLANSFATKLDLNQLGQPSGAAMLDSTGTLSGNMVLGTGTTTPLSLADAAMQRLDPRRFGARCDGITDDQAAFNRISAYLNAASSSLIRTNTAWEIDIAGGRCILSQPWVLAYGSPNISVHIHGDGSAHSELEWTGGTNGIVVSFAANASGNEMARSSTWAGQGIAVDGLHFIAANGSTRAGTALTVNGIPLTNASNPPFQRYSDLVFGNDNGYSDNAANWAGGLYLVNPDNVNARDLMWWDQAHQSNTTSIPFHLHSTAPAGGPGHGNLTFDNITAQGGGTGFQIDGNAFQGINLSHIFTVYVQTGISWVANPNTLSGTLTIDHSSLGAQQNIVTLANISTVFSDDNLYYNTSPPTGHNFYALSSLGGDTIQSHGDTFIGPAPGALGAGFQSEALVVFSPAAFDPQGSVISGDSVSGFDVGYVASGGPISFKDDRAASTTTTCYQDAGGQASSALHPDFDGITCGQTLNKEDGQGLALAYSWAPQRFLNGSLELGMPGTTSPGGVKGYAGQIDFHSVAAATPGALNDNDFRISPFGGVAGTPGQGGLLMSGTGGVAFNGPITNSANITGLNLYSTGGLFSNTIVPLTAGAQVQLGNGSGVLIPGPVGTSAAPLTIDSSFMQSINGPILAPAFRFIGAAIPISATSPCDQGTIVTGAAPFGYGLFDCYATNQWASTTLTPGITGSPTGSGGSGTQGPPGTAATVAVGTTTTGAPGSQASVSNSGSSSAATLNFTIPQGAPGAAGTSPTLAAGTASALASTASPTVSDSGSGSSHIFNFGIPVGTPGAAGGTPTFSIGTVTTGAAGSAASVTDNVSGLANTLSFSIPQGAQGAPGSGSGGAAAYTSPAVLTGAQTLMASMCGQDYQSSDTAAVTYTVPSGLTNCRIRFVQGGGGQITFTGASGVTVNAVGGTPATSAQWATVVLRTLNAANTLVLGND